MFTSTLVAFAAVFVLGVFLIARVSENVVFSIDNDLLPLISDLSICDLWESLTNDSNQLIFFCSLGNSKGTLNDIVTILVSNHA